MFQNYDGVPVFGGELILTFNERKELISYLGKYIPNLKINTQPKTSTEEIKRIVAQDLQIDAITQQPKLFIFNRGVLADTREETFLAWRIGTHGWVYFVNAQTKEILHKYDDSHGALSREVYSAGGGTPTLPGTSEITEGDDTSVIAPGDALNAYNYSENVYNYYNLNFGLDSYDDIGSTMVSTVDYDTSNFARWCNYLKSQDVDDCPAFQGVLFYTGYTVLDITAHEWTHAVDDYAVRDEGAGLYGLTMSDESGALNESYSDIFGVLIEEEYGAELDWDIGEDSPGGIIRNLADPTASATSQPDDWSGYDSSQDSHYNSGIPNKAGYLMMREASEGYETFNSIDVRGMGTDMAEEIFYYALRDELLISATFEDNLNALLVTCYTLETIDIDTTDCESIYDAYTAIGVADGTVTFIEANITTDVSSGYGPLTVNFDATDSVSFGRNITDYTWDFGDGTTTSTGTTATTSHTYDPGNYTATLTITDSDGQTDTETINIVAYVPTTISADTTWSADDSPYIVYGDVNVNSGSTLTIEPGTIVKFYDSTSGLTISGTLTAVGTSIEPIILTSYNDDDYGGDTNGDSTATTPAAGDWSTITISSGGSATFNYALVHYGGYDDGSGSIWDSAMLLADTNAASVTVSNSTLQYSQFPTIQTKTGSTMTISDSIITNDIASQDAIYIAGGTATITNNTITADGDGLGGFGVYVGNGVVSITDNMIVGTFASIWLQAADSTSTVSSNTVSGSTYYYGIYNGVSSIIIT